MRKRSPLSSPEWKTIPWKTIPKTPKDLLIDILTETPGLLEDVDTLKAQQDPDIRAALRQELIDKCWVLELELEAWRTRVHISPTYALDALTSPFSMDLLAASHVMCTYWAACIMIYGTLEPLLPESEVADLPPHMNARIYFRRVAEAMTVMTHPSSGVYGMQLSHFPTALTLAYINALGGGEDERDMIFDTYKRSGREGVVEGFQESIRVQGTRNGWGSHRALEADRT